MILSRLRLAVRARRSTRSDGSRERRTVAPVGSLSGALRLTGLPRSPRTAPSPPPGSAASPSRPACLRNHAATSSTLSTAPPVSTAGGRGVGERRARSAPPPGRVSSVVRRGHAPPAPARGGSGTTARGRRARRAGRRTSSGSRACRSSVSRSSSHSQRLQPVAQRRRLLELERRRGRLHQLLQRRRGWCGRGRRGTPSPPAPRPRTPSAYTPPTHGPRHVPDLEPQALRARGRAANSSAWSANASGTVCGQSRSLNQSFSRRRRVLGPLPRRRAGRSTPSSFPVGVVRDVHVRGRRLADADVVVPLQARHGRGR